MADRGAGRLADAWWSRRFLDVIEGLGLADALRGGRRLVRTEAVLDLRRSGNLVVAMVRGPDDETVKARIAVRTFSGTAWTRVEQALAARAGYAATLLAGAMPAEIDRVFAALGLSLFPTAADDLAMDCSCEDWQRPCAHIAAACYQLAQTLDRDPFALLALRGRERDPFLDGLRTHRVGLPPGADEERIEAARRRDQPSAHRDRPADGDRTRPAGAAGAAGATASTPSAAPSLAAALPATVEAFWSNPQGTEPEPEPGTEPEPEEPVSVPAGEARGRSSEPQPLGSERFPAALDVCGPLIVEPLGDLRRLLLPAYEIFMAASNGDRRGASPSGGQDRHDDLP